jgi:hypothetical protein
VGYVEKEGVMLRNLTTLNETNVLVYGWSKGVLWQKKMDWLEYFIDGDYSSRSCNDIVLR